MKKIYRSILIGLLVICLGLPGWAQQVFINEIHYDNEGADTGEAVEVAAPAGTDLTGWSLIFYNGSGGSSYATVALTGVVANQENGYGTAFFTQAGIQNGAPDGVALVNASSVVIQFLSYEGAFSAVGGPADGMMSTDIGVSESGSTPVGNSLQLIGTGSEYSDFTWQSDAVAGFGAVNPGQIFAPVDTDPVINEFVLNHTGADTNEFVEILGMPDTDYADLWLLEIEGDGTSAGTIDEVIQLGSTDDTGYWTTAFLSNAFENGTLSLLLVRNFTGTQGDDIDIDDDGAVDNLLWDELVDGIGVHDGGAGDINYSAIVLLQGFDGSSFTVGGASRIPNGVDTGSASDWVRNSFSGAGLPDFPSAEANAGEALSTPGTSNEVASGPVAPIVINEIDADTPGTDTAEFIELYDGGIGKASLDGLVLVFYNGSNDLSYNAFDLTGYATDAQGYFVLGNAGVTDVSIEFPSNGLQNGADAVALYEGTAADFPSGSTITTENLLDAVVYGTNDSDDPELLVLLNPGEPQLNEDEGGDKDNESLQRLPNGAGGAGNTSSFATDTPTPGAENGGVIVDPGEMITIAEARAAAIGEPVTIAGVLTATDHFSGPAYIQDATAGIAVFDAAVHGDMLFQIGDSIKITGIREVFNDQVQISGVSSVEHYGPAISPIAPQVVTLDQLSAHPGELVRVLDASFPHPGDLLFGNSNYTLTDASGSGDLRVDGDVEELAGLAQPEACDAVTGIVGRFLTFYQLLPRRGADMPCTEKYEPVGDDLNIPASETFDVATFNIEWFGDENNSPAAGSADSDAIQKDSVKAILELLDADVIAVQEITDLILFDQMISELPGYGYVLSSATSYPGSADAQHVGFIYNTATVSPDTVASKSLLSTIHPIYNGGDASFLPDYPNDPSRFWASGRLPYMMVADVTIQGVTKTIHLVAVHGRANSSSGPQGRYDMRKYDVEVLKDTLDAQFADANIVMLGDFNDDLDFTVADIPTTVSSYEAYALDTASYLSVTLTLSENGFRSYVFRENMIDHIIVSDELSEEFIVGSARVGYQHYDSDYTRTVSDHLVVSARFEFTDDVTFNEFTAVEVISFSQGSRRNGRPIHWWRSNPEKALGEPLENYYFNFVSLGFGGEITLKLDNMMHDLSGNEFRVFESTFGPLDIPCYWYPERAEVLASKDGTNFHSLGTTCLDGEFDLAASGLNQAQYIKIRDISDPQDFFGNADGYDLDGIYNLIPTPANKTGRGFLLQDHENYAPNEETGFEVSVHPNPFTRYIKLKFSVEEEVTTKVRVVDVMGREHFEQEVNLHLGSHALVIDLENVPKGLYILEVKDDQGGLEQTVRVVKE